MVNLLTLDFKGSLLALLMGILIFVFGKNLGFLFLIDILLFLVLSAVVTRVGSIRKHFIIGYGRKRGWKNVLANGIMPLVIVFIFAIISARSSVETNFLALGYIASVSAITADKFSSEIGVLDGKPIMLLTRKKVRKGMSGAVTALGLCFGLLGAGIIGISAFTLSGSIVYVVIVTISGFFGTIIDSVFGYYEEKGIGNKHTSNFLCSLSAFLLCILLLLY